jgi:GMP synthase-like glutamine amidotransferase
MRVLSVNHGPTVPGGVFDEAVVARGHVLERWQVPEGGAPEPVEAYDAVMVFGGSMHPDQDDDFHWLASEEAFLKEVLAADVPVIGVCLGAQMLARAAGAAVGPAREPEIGWYRITLTSEGASDPVLGSLTSTATVFQWHHYAFALPPGGVALAESPVCLQAFRVGRAWGIQFHAEVTLPMLRAWLDEEPHDLEEPDRMLVESCRSIERSNAQGRALCTAFLAAAEDPQREGATSAATSSAAEA